MASSRPDMWDCIVIGAGVVGSWTALHLAKAGKKVLLLEQFCLPHSRGSSHGQSRIIRMTYNDSRYVEMMPESFALWEQLETDSQQTLLRRSGMLNVEAAGGRKIAETRDSMIKHHLPFDELTPNEMRQKYPMFKFPENCIGLFDRSAGMLLNDKCLAVLRNEIVRRGGMICDGQRVTGLYPGSHVTVKTTQKTYVAKKVVVTAGPWSTDIMKKLGLNIPIKTMPGRSFYWRDFSNGTLDLESGAPLVTHFVEEKNGYRFYCFFPAMEYEGLVKIVTRGEPSEIYCHPDDRDRHPMQHMKELLQKYIRNYIPNVDSVPSIEEPCMYTMTPDGDYILDHHPLYTNIIFGCGMSGHGFKTAPVTGKILSEMASDKKTSYSLGPFKMKRFAKPTSKL